MNIGILVGSLRKASFNRKVAQTLIDIAPNTMQIQCIEIADLPFFNQDIEDNPPKPWVSFRNQIKTLDGIILVTPEYNRSFPAALKNALDVGSRPYGQNLWNGMPAAVISASIGAIGGFGANHHLRQSLAYLNMPCLAQPEVYLSFVDKLFDAHDTMVNETQTFLLNFLTAFEQWVKTHSA